MIRLFCISTILQGADVQFYSGSALSADDDSVRSRLSVKIVRASPWGEASSLLQSNHIAKTICIVSPGPLGHATTGPSSWRIADRSFQHTLTAWPQEGSREIVRRVLSPKPCEHSSVFDRTATHAVKLRRTKAKQCSMTAPQLRHTLVLQRRTQPSCLLRSESHGGTRTTASCVCPGRYIEIKE